MNLLHRRDIYLAAACILAAVLLYIGNLYMNRRPAVYVSISVDGSEIQQFDLKQDQEFMIPGYGGGSNYLIIRDGEAWIEEASCPDKICIYQGKVHQSGEMIICLPNRMVVEIVGE